ncbi:uncharacterized protein B0H18DRAFT_1018955 [Fomitopsis serialis]|uniref:uncharacterized protein n=1 Tax=Fomitopsis serialis TaxID=139415 RepID=UPI00200820D4|nr:uncharacterized protein B0H18DRAFT_1018955 [Neoantrodia serialis]KAH9922062.1 hypothetical protein B0H18DRAFT_1018955 [Neoantrodia serialis]
MDATALKRPKLQQLARMHNIKANLKNGAIIEQLRKRRPGSEGFNIASPPNGQNSETRASLAKDPAPAEPRTRLSSSPTAANGTQPASNPGDPRHAQTPLPQGESETGRNGVVDNGLSVNGHVNSSMAAHASSPASQQAPGPSGEAPAVDVQPPNVERVNGGTTRSGTIEGEAGGAQHLTEAQRARYAARQRKEVERQREAYRDAARRRRREDQKARHRYENAALTGFAEQHEVIYSVRLLRKAHNNAEHEWDALESMQEKVQGVLASSRTHIRTATMTHASTDRFRTFFSYYHPVPGKWNPADFWGEEPEKRTWRYFRTGDEDGVAEEPEGHGRLPTYVPPRRPTDVATEICKCPMPAGDRKMKGLKRLNVVVPNKLAQRFFDSLRVGWDVDYMNKRLWPESEDEGDDETEESTDQPPKTRKRKAGHDEEEGGSTLEGETEEPANQPPKKKLRKAGPQEEGDKEAPNKGKGKAKNKGKKKTSKKGKEKAHTEDHEEADEGSADADDVEGVDDAEENRLPLYRGERYQRMIPTRAALWQITDNERIAAEGARKPPFVRICAFSGRELASVLLQINIRRLHSKSCPLAFLPFELNCVGTLLNPLVSTVVAGYLTFEGEVIPFGSRRHAVRSNATPGTGQLAAAVANTSAHPAPVVGPVGDTAASVYQPSNIAPGTGPSGDAPGVAGAARQSQPVRLLRNADAIGAAIILGPDFLPTVPIAEGSPFPQGYSGEWASACIPGAHWTATFKAIDAMVSNGYTPLADFHHIFLDLLVASILYLGGREPTIAQQVSRYQAGPSQPTRNNDDGAADRPALSDFIFAKVKNNPAFPLECAKAVLQPDLRARTYDRIERPQELIARYSVVHTGEGLVPRTIVLQDKDPIKDFLMPCEQVLACVRYSGYPDKLPTGIPQQGTPGAPNAMQVNGAQPVGAVQQVNGAQQSEGAQQVDDDAMQVDDAATDDSDEPISGVAARIVNADRSYDRDGAAEALRYMNASARASARDNTNSPVTPRNPGWQPGMPGLRFEEHTASSPLPPPDFTQDGMDSVAGDGDSAQPSGLHGDVEDGVSGPSGSEDADVVAEAPGVAMPARSLPFSPIPEASEDEDQVAEENIETMLVAKSMSFERKPANVVGEHSDAQVPPQPTSPPRRVTRSRSRPLGPGPLPRRTVPRRGATGSRRGRVGK